MSEIKRILSLLEPEHQPTMLEQFRDYSAFQLLIMTLLSARTKDTTVIPIAKKMFLKWKTPADFVKAPLKQLQQEIYGVGFYNVKARHVKELSQKLLREFNGEVPRTLEELISLPGVGRKTANCLLAQKFKVPAIGVDTHVHRISNLMGWVKTNNTLETEEKLMKIVPRELWVKVNPMLVDLGQRVCLPRRPQCGKCVVRRECEYGKRKIMGERKSNKIKISTISSSF